MDEFIDVLKAIKADGKYEALALSGAPERQLGSDDVVLCGIGPNYWHGQEGNQGLIAGERSSSPIRDSLMH